MTPRRQPPRLPTLRYRVCVLLLMLLLLLGDSDGTQQHAAAGLRLVQQARQKRRKMTRAHYAGGLEAPV
jgi:hypothetical protein